jgi:serine/threonine protein kinase
MQLRPGQTLAQGRYTIQRALSKGGMGAIYLAADHDAFDRIVVVKAMLDYFDPADPQAVQSARDRFLQEAKTLAALRHPAIPQIYTYFQDGPRNYIVMEWIEGLDLEQRLSHRDDTTSQSVPGQPYPEADVLRWGVALCRVLEYLASRKPDPVVHHDIKPANLVLDSNSGDIRLVDFGTARARLLIQSGGVGLAQSSIYGTNGYAAPEQYRGQSEARSDVYALAATLYHLATDDDPRSHPFSFPRLMQIGELGPALGSALNRDVKRRPSALELRHRLEALLAPAALPIQAPDGADLADERALVGWCERHWDEGIDWLYGGLPEQIQVVWGKTKLARDVREAIRLHDKDRDAGFDAALALLDPAGFGAAQPSLKSSISTLDYGTLRDHRYTSDRTVILTNSGRRYVQARLQLPSWLSTDTPGLALRPGQQAEVKLIANEWRINPFSAAHEVVELQQAGRELLRIGARAETGLYNSLWRTHSPLMLLPLLCAIAIGIGAIFGAAPRTFNPSAPSRPRAPSDAIRRGLRWQKGTVSLALSLERPVSSHSSLAFSSDGKILASGAEDGVIRLWRANHDTQQSEMGAKGVQHVSIAFSPIGDMLAASGPNGTIVLLGANDAISYQSLKGNGSRVLSIAFSPAGDILAAGTLTGTIVLWEINRDSTLLRTFAHQSAPIISIAFSPDGQLLAAADGEMITLWNPYDGMLLRTFGGQGHIMRAVAFSPDGQLLAAADGETITFWGTRDGAQLGRLVGHTGQVHSVAFSPDGMTLASGGSDHTVKLWHVGDRRLLQTLAEHQDAVRSVAFSPDGQLLASGGDQTIKIWRPQP